MFFHFTQPILNFLSNLVYYLLIFAIFLSIFSFIYLGIKIYLEKRNYSDFKLALLFIILGTLLLGIIFIKKEIIFELIKIFVPKF